MSDKRAAASCGACRVTRSQNTAMRRKNARFCEDGSWKCLPEGLRLVDFNGVTYVCTVVSMRAVAVQRDGDEQEWNATTLELR
jgi:hypothetical protein